MTAELAPHPFITVEEYLEGEMHSEVRHEYFDGNVMEMPGTTDSHELVAGNFFFVLMAHLRGKGCRVYKDGMKLRLRIMERDLLYYPDVMVTCDPTDNHRLYKERPKLVAEILSEDVKKDLIEKLFVYRGIESLEEYVVLGQDIEHPEVRIYRRANEWGEPETHRDSAANFTLQSLGLTLTLGELYVA